MKNNIYYYLILFFYFQFLSLAQPYMKIMSYLHEINRCINY